MDSSIHGGLFAIKKVFIKTYKDVPLNNPNGVSERIVVSIFEDKDTLLWIGTDGGGINILDPETGHFSLLEHVPGSDNYSLPANSILCLYNDYNNNIWQAASATD